MGTVQAERQDLLIGGSWTAASSGRSFDNVDPFTGEIVGSAAAATPEDAGAAVAAAAAAFPAWAATSPAERRELLGAAAALLEERAAELAEVMTQETGSTFGWGMFNTHLAAGMLREAAAQTYALVGEVIPSDVPGKLAMAVRVPAGVVVGMAPWNGPIILGTRAIATPLAYGNTVVLKASEQCPRTHAGIVKALIDAGLPAGTVNYISHDAADAPQVVEALIAAPGTRRINFTGSTRVGRIIAETAGRHLKPVLLELGGKAPFLVLADADLDRAVAAAKFGAFMHQGQICMSTERIVADASVAEEFAGRLGARADELVVGDPREASTQIGPLVTAASLRKIEELVADAMSKGAQVMSGGEVDGPCYRPTVLYGVTPEMRIYSEESFGPVVSVIPVADEDEAIRTANDTEYGLSAAVFSRDVPRALELAQRIRSGICHINDATVQDEPQMPFGGVKDSGWGRFGGSAAVGEFSDLRWMTVQNLPRDYPI
ncbi:MAG: aldehyde dehydrogenase [Solirubrobacterales bacterium]